MVTGNSEFTSLRDTKHRNAYYGYYWANYADTLLDYVLYGYNHVFSSIYLPEMYVPSL